MTRYIDNDPSAEFPYAIFDPETAEVIDRCTNFLSAVRGYPGTVIIRTYTGRKS